VDIQGLLDSLSEKTSPADREIVQRAFMVADKVHSKQKRASGEPYVNHCLAVAGILSDLGAPIPVVVSGLLHDTVEDTPITLDDIERDFGEEVRVLVDGVTKLAQLPRVSYSGKRARDPLALKGDLAKETLRKTFLAMGDDVRVVVIKLADRLHNMRTLSHLPPEKQTRIAKETLEIFAPLASRLGIWQMKWDLEDLAFRYAFPEQYIEIAALVSQRREDREKKLRKVTAELRRYLLEYEIDAEVTGRPKHLYSIHRKMERKGVPIVPGTFDDYIATPKDNFYQSLHTAVIYDDGKTLEVQIRTPKMHENAEYGIAAHWRYKEGRSRDDSFEQRVTWLRRLMEWRQDVDDAGDFVAAMKSDVFDDRVYVFTPKGDIIDLPADSTPIDFTGDAVEILTAKRGGPSRDWLNPSLEMVKSQRARGKIRHWFRRQDREQNVSHGRLLLEREIRRLGLDGMAYEKIASDMGYSSVDDLLMAIGCGDLNINRIVTKLIPEEDLERELEALEEPAEFLTELDAEEVHILGLSGLLTRLGRCCNPAPGDPIVGYITRGRGATIHRQDCPNALRARDRERLIQVSWGKPHQTYPVAVTIRAYDRDGLIRDVSTLVANEGISMSAIQVSTKDNLAVFDMIMGITDVSQLSRVLNRLEALPNVLEARRIRPG